MILVHRHPSDGLVCCKICRHRQGCSGDTTLLCWNSRLCLQVTQHKETFLYHTFLCPGHTGHGVIACIKRGQGQRRLPIITCHPIPEHGTTSNPYTRIQHQLHLQSIERADREDKNHSTNIQNWQHGKLLGGKAFVQHQLHLQSIEHTERFQHEKAAGRGTLCCGRRYSTSLTPYPAQLFLLLPDHSVCLQTIKHTRPSPALRDSREQKLWQESDSDDGTLLNAWKTILLSGHPPNFADHPARRVAACIRRNPAAEATAMAGGQACLLQWHLAELMAAA